MVLVLVLLVDAEQREGCIVVGRRWGGVCRRTFEMLQMRRAEMRLG